VGRLIRDADDPTAADIAVTVADQWHGRGVATALIQALLARRPKEVTTLRTMTTADDVTSLAVLAAAGPLATRMEHGVIEVRIDVPAGYAQQAHDSSSVAHRSVDPSRHRPEESRTRKKLGSRKPNP